MNYEEIGDVVRITLDVPRDVWELLHEVTGIGQDWREIAVKALEAGLEQASAPTNATARPRGVVGH